MNPRDLSEPQLVQRFAAARDAQDWVFAKACWDEIAAHNLDRIRGMVRGFSFPGGQRMPDGHLDGAESEAVMRVLAFGERFGGHTVGQLRVGVKQEVWNACMDFGRRELRHEKRYGGSIDAAWGDGEDGEGSPYDKILARHADELERDREDTEEAEREREQQLDLIRWAIPQITNANYREALNFTYVEWLDGNTAAERLGITRDNFYKRRERAINALERFLRDLPSTDTE